MKHFDKALIWDFDGTLAYREGGWAAALLDVLRNEIAECAVTHDQLRPHLRDGFPWHATDQAYPPMRSAEQWWNALDPLFERAFTGVGIDAERARTLAPEVRHTYSKLTYWRLFDDTMPAIETLSSQGWAQVILSNHVPELKSIIEHLQLSPHLPLIFNSAETGYEKPHPQAFRNVLTALGNPRRIWMIGDNMSADVLGAEGVGIPAILVRRHHEDARYYCENLLQLPSIVNRKTIGRLTTENGQR